MKLMVMIYANAVFVDHIFRVICMKLSGCPNLTFWAWLDRYLCLVFQWDHWVKEEKQLHSEVPSGVYNNPRLATSHGLPPMRQITPKSKKIKFYFGLILSEISSNRQIVVGWIFKIILSWRYWANFDCSSDIGIHFPRSIYPVVQQLGSWAPFYSELLVMIPHHGTMLHSLLQSVICDWSGGGPSVCSRWHDWLVDGQGVLISWSLQQNWTEHILMLVYTFIPF